MAFANGCYRAFFLAQTVGPSASGSTSLVLNHALGATPMVRMTPVGLPIANQSIPLVLPSVVSRTTSYIALATNTLSGVVVDVECDIIHTITQ